MEPLSITASVVAIIQISTKIISTCSDYIRDVKDAPGDLQKIMFEVAAVKGIFEALSLLFPPKDDVNAAVPQHSFIFLCDSVDGCAQELEALEALFPKSEDCSSKGKRRKYQLSLSSLAWPLKAHRAKKHLENISQYKATISLALSTKSCLDLSDIGGKIERIQDDLSGRERQDILNWLVTTDPSSNHNRACELHEPHTGKWLTRSPEYAKWKNALTRLIWLHGIPGAGKTVLASFIFKDVKSFCKDSVLENTGWAYYYCYFGHEQDETPHLLRWVINQLCRQMNAIPDEVRELFSDGGSPQTQELAVALGAVLRNYHRVYLVIDALDESLDRHRILNLLLGILDDQTFDKLQVLATSRKELDIERALLISSVDISMSNSYVDEDIRVYIQHTLRVNHKFCRWPEELQREIETALVKGAKGMFRWAFCQLDILKRLHTVQDIRKALGALPRTLDETYERILCSIPLENHSIVSRTLQLLAFDTGIVHLDVLLDALAVDVEGCTFSRDNRILDSEALLEVCTCLITIRSDTYSDHPQDEYYTVRLAHYTVKEYIISDRIGHGSAITFQISEESASLFAAKCFITYMLHGGYYQLWFHSRYWCSDDLMKVALSNWIGLTRKIHSHAAWTAITPMVLRLLDVTGPHFQKWIEGYNFVLCEEYIDEHIPEWTVTPGGESCLILVYLCYFDLFEVAQQFVKSFPEDVSFETEIEAPLLGRPDGDVYRAIRRLNCIDDGRLLHIAASGGRVSFVEYFISNGANVNAVSTRGLSVLGSAVCKDPTTSTSHAFQTTREMVELLLKAGADPNIPGVLFTPLQRLMSVWASSEDDSVMIARALIDAGADVNSVGDDESDLSRLLLTIEAYRLQAHEYGSTFSEVEEMAIASHSLEWNYDSPLKIINRHLQKPGMRQDELDRLERMKDLLITHGAKSLHRTPKHYPPAYVQARIEEHLGWVAARDLRKTPIDDSQWLAESP